MAALLPWLIAGFLICCTRDQEPLARKPKAPAGAVCLLQFQQKLNGTAHASKTGRWGWKHESTPDADDVMQTITWMFTTGTVGKALAQVAIMSGAGVVLTSRGIITEAVCHALAQLSFSLLMPALLFTKLLYCQPCVESARGSCTPCTDISEVIHRSWYLALLPFVVVGCGMALGKLLVTFCTCPKGTEAACIAAVCLGNSTGMPVVLLEVLTPSLIKTGVIGEDPLIYLSVYLVVYSLLQWTVGRFLFDKSTNATGHPVYEPAYTLTGRCCLAVISLIERAKFVMVPPVLATLLGLGISLMPPVHRMMVDTTGDLVDPPLGFIFAALSRIAEAAVPINLMVLGSGLWNAAGSLPLSTGVCVAIAKLLIMPSVIGVLVLSLAPTCANQEKAQWLVAVVVSATPTANSLAVIAELSGSSKAALSACIIVQYMLAPLTLTIVITCTIMLM